MGKLKKFKIVDNYKMADEEPLTPSPILEVKTLSNLMQQWGATYKWIHYTLDSKNNKKNICGRKHN